MAHCLSCLATPFYATICFSNLKVPSFWFYIPIPEITSWGGRIAVLLSMNAVSAIFCFCWLIVGNLFLTFQPLGVQSSSWNSEAQSQSACKHRCNIVRVGGCMLFPGSSHDCYRSCQLCKCSGIPFRRGACENHQSPQATCAISEFNSSRRHTHLLSLFIYNSLFMYFIFIKFQMLALSSTCIWLKQACKQNSARLVFKV